MSAWSRRKPAFVCLVVLAVSACDRKEITGSRIESHTVRKAASCDDPDASTSGCTGLVQFDAEERLGYLADSSPDPADPASPLWDGRAEESYEAEGSRPFCPQGWPSPTFQVHVILTNESAVFEIPGMAWLEGIIGTRGGYPIGAYAMPPGYYNDLTGRYQASGGSIIAECHVVQLRMPGVASVNTGYIRSINYTGQLWMNGSSGLTGGSSRGWSYHNGSTGQTSGFSDSTVPGIANQVANTYMSGGGCTPGWEIWVDGVQVCKSDGTRVS